MCMYSPPSRQVISPSMRTFPVTRRGSNCAVRKSRSSSRPTPTKRRPAGHRTSGISTSATCYSSKVGSGYLIFPQRLFMYIYHMFNITLYLCVMFYFSSNHRSNPRSLWLPGSHECCDIGSGHPHSRSTPGAFHEEEPPIFTGDSQKQPD